MKKIIIWGAGNIGKQAYVWCKNRFEIFGFADNDKTKWGREFLNCNIISPDDAVSCDYPILVATIYAEEVVRQLFDMGVPHERISLFQVTIQNMNTYLYNFKDHELEQKYRKNIKEICMGKLLQDCVGQTIGLDAVSCVTGSSNILDYALLKSLMIKFRLKSYLEIGTYIGDSLHIISEVAEHCYSITVPPEHPMSMKFWCQNNYMHDFSNRLVNKENMIQYLEDSTKFDFGVIRENIDLYFIDADHSYDGVKNDTEKVFKHRGENSFVVWHDFKCPANQLRLSVISAVEDSLGRDEFKKVYMFDNNLCGLYVPSKYKEIFDAYCEFDVNDLYTYKLDMDIQKMTDH